MLVSQIIAAAITAASVVATLVPQKGGLLDIKPFLVGKPVPAGIAPPAPTKSGFFNQTVDHFGHQQGVNGTWFNQLYYIQDTYYKSGGPVIFFLAGESPQDDSFISGGYGSLISSLLLRYNAMAVTLEHRFYGAGADPTFPGRSTPTADLSFESLKLLTTDQALEDNANFIRKFASTFPEYNLPASTKWITVGGSYPGALSAWMREFYPDLVYAAHAASAPVQLQMDFSDYSLAVDEGMTFLSNLYYKNGDACMQGYTRAVQLFDFNLFEGQFDPASLQAFKAKFWMSQVNSTFDVGQLATANMGGTVQYFPSASILNGTTLLDIFCSGKHFPAFTDPNATDDQLLEALQSYTILQLESYGFTGDDESNYLNTVAITDFSLGGQMTSYLFWYQACREFGYGQVAQHFSQFIEDWSVYSQFVSVSGWENWCNTLGLTKHANELTILQSDLKFGGDDIRTPRILWVNGQYDPWHYLSVLKPFPGQDALLFKNASHCNDLWGPTSGFWPPVSQDYETGFFNQLFAVYDKWIGITN